MTILCEIMVKEYLPMLRASAAYHLINDHRYTQEKAAAVLGVTQAAISKSIVNYKTISQNTDEATKETLRLGKILSTEIVGGLKNSESLTSICTNCGHKKSGVNVCSLNISINKKE